MGRAELAESGRSLAADASRDEAAAIERRADAVIGIQVRRLAYAALLPGHADVVKRAMFQSAAGWHRVAGNLTWPLVWRLIMKNYDIGPGAAADSRAKLEAELDWLDGLLADGRPYLAGERFSRADLTVASLLGPFARPREMKVYHEMRAPEALAADVRRWSERPVMRFVRGAIPHPPPPRRGVTRCDRPRAPGARADNVRRRCSAQWPKGFQDALRRGGGALARAGALVRALLRARFFRLEVLLDLGFRRRSAWHLLISPASTRADTHILESFFAERDMQARKPSLPTA